MPELPEVEFAARSLRRWMAGRTVREARLEECRVFRGTDRAALERALVDRRLEWVERRGKYLLLGFDGGVGLLSHLGMTGKWLRVGPQGELPGHVRARLLLDDGSTVAYRDPRLFGRIALHDAAHLFELPEIRGLGPDPLHDGVDPKRLHQRLRRTDRPVKVAIMDQAVMAGVGNIQATDALFHARIHPARRGSSLSLAEVERLAAGIERSIADTLARIGEGDAIEYVEEGAENPFVVYGRAGHPCPRCTATLEKVELGGRTSVFCPVCQPI